MWTYLFVIIGIITFVFLVHGFLLQSEDQREFSQNIALILIPIIAGGIVTKFTTDSWQITKEKLEIKRTILSDYEQSYKQMSLLQENYVYRVIESYITYSKTEKNIRLKDYDNETYGIEAYVEIPNDVNKKPKIKLEKEYCQFSLDLQSASLIQNRFFSSIRLYFGSDNLETIIRNIEKSIRDCSDIILKLQNTATAEELVQYYNYFKQANDTVIIQLKELETQLVSLRFGAINV